MVATSGRPGSVALMTSPDSVAGIERLNPPSTTFPQEVAARFAFEIIRAFPGRKAKHITCPAFFAVCEQDTIAPPVPTRRYAAQAPGAEIKLDDAGHFDIYVGDDFEVNVTDQLDFLRRRLPVA